MSGILAAPQSRGETLAYNVTAVANNLSASRKSQAANISTRREVETRDNVMIGGR
jgi:hypothetical protein